MIFRKTLLAALLCTPAISMAATAGAAGTGNLDIYYVDSETEFEGGGSVDGDGFGIRGAGKIADQIFLYGEYQSVEYDFAGDPETEQIRAGGGFFFLQQTEMAAYGKAEFINVDSDFTDDDSSGFGLHAGLNFMPMPALALTGQVGYIDIEDADGPEYLLGASYNITPQIGIFTDYRFTDLESDAGDAEIKDWRIGGRFNF